jgi:uncharacterized membrane protein YedE/YeeE
MGFSILASGFRLLVSNSLTTLYLSKAASSFTIISMNYVGIRIAFLVLVIVLCCGWSLWTLSGKKSERYPTPQMMQADPGLIYFQGIEQSGF